MLSRSSKHFSRAAETSNSLRGSLLRRTRSSIPYEMQVRDWLECDRLSSSNPLFSQNARYFSTNGKPFATNASAGAAARPNPFASSAASAGTSRPNPFASSSANTSRPNPFVTSSANVNPFASSSNTAKKSSKGNIEVKNVPPTVNGYAFIHPEAHKATDSLVLGAEYSAQNPFAPGGRHSKSLPPGAVNPFAAASSAKSTPYAQKALSERVMAQGQAQNPFAPRRVSTTLVEEARAKQERAPKATNSINPFSISEDASLTDVLPETLSNPFVVRKLVVPYNTPKMVTNQTNPFLKGVSDQHSIFERAKRLSEEKENMYSGALPIASPRGGGKDLITALRQNIKRKAEQARLEASLSSSVTDNSGVFDNSFLGVLRQMNRRSKKTSRDLFESSTFGASPETLAMREERKQAQEDRQAALERAAVVSDLQSDLQQMERAILREAKNKKVVPIYTAQTVRAFAKLMGVHMNRVVEGLIEFSQDSPTGRISSHDINPNYMITQEQAEGIAILNNVEPMIYNSTSPDEVAALLELIDGDLKRQLPSRSPVVTIMGHVDHGKTTLLDAYRQTSVADAEAGRITQSIGSFSVEIDTSLHDFVPSVTFLDTPGHAIFTKMREKGTKNGLTDIVVLVLSAADSVQPQTKEVVQLAREAGRPLIVAVTKCDIEGVDPDMVRQELAEELDVVCEQIGGDVPSVNVSARTGEGLMELLEAIALQAGSMELKFRPRVDIAPERINDWIEVQDAFSKGEGLLEVRAKQEIEALRLAAEEIDGSDLPVMSDPDYKVEKELLREQRMERKKEILQSNELSHLADFALGYAYVVETQVQRGAGVLVNAVVRQGEVRVGDHIVCGTQHATIRSLIDHNGKTVSSVNAHKSAPVQILGIPNYEGLGDDIIIVPHERMASHLTEARAKEESRIQAIADLASSERSQTNRPNVEREYIDRGRRSRAVQYQETDAMRLDTERDSDSTLRVVVKSDVNGSLGAIQGYVEELIQSPHSELARVIIVKAGLGDITEQDIDFANARGAIVVGFNVKMANRVSQYAKDIGVLAETSSVIFRTFDVIRDAVSKLLPRRFVYEVKGAATVEALFNLNFTKVALKKLAHARADLDGNPMDIEPKCIVAGSRVISGELVANQDYKWRIMRDSEPFMENLELAQLRHFKDEVQSVPKGKDCGILLARSSLVQDGDVLECYKLREDTVVFNDTIARGHREDNEYDYNSTLKYNEKYELVTLNDLRESRGLPAINE